MDFKTLKPIKKVAKMTDPIRYPNIVINYEKGFENNYKAQQHSMLEDITKQLIKFIK